MRMFNTGKHQNMKIIVRFQDVDMFIIGFLENMSRLTKNNNSF